MERIKAENVRVGMGLRTYLGTHTVVNIEPYVGPFDFVLNILVFSNGSKMSNTTNDIYDLFTLPA